jgi:hypothetical protein
MIKDSYVDYTFLCYWALDVSVSVTGTLGTPQFYRKYMNNRARKKTKLFYTHTTKQNNLKKFHRVQRMMNIKIAKAFRTLSYEASCVLAGILPIRLAIDGKVRTYKATHNNTEYDAPLEVRYWPHPAEIPLIRAPPEIRYNVIYSRTAVKLEERSELLQS